MATPKKTSNSSIAVDIETTLRLEAYTKRLGITKKEYIAISLDYFERTGIDPRSNDTQTEWDKLKELIVTTHKEQMDAQQKGFKQQSEKTDTEIKLLADMAIRQDVFQQQQKHQTLLLESAEQRAEQEEQEKAEAKAKKKSWWKF